MITVTERPVKELEYCPTFRAFMTIWKQTRSPPLEFIDYLKEQERYRAAGGVNWVINRPDCVNWVNTGHRTFPLFRKREYSWSQGRMYSDCLYWISADDCEFSNLDSALYFLMDTYPEPLI